MEDKQSDVAIGFRDLAQDIEYRFESLERDKACEYTVDALSSRVYDLEGDVEDLKDQVSQLHKLLGGDKHGT